MANSAFISIVDCGLCAELLTRHHLRALPLPEAWARLDTIATFEPGPGPGTDLGDREEVRMCRSCGTYYEYRYVYDPSDILRAESTDWFLSRITPQQARAVLSDTGPYGVAARSQREPLDRRYATLIELLCRDLARAPNPHIRKYMVDSLYEHYLLEELGWNGLKATLIDPPDPAVRVYAASCLLRDGRKAAKRLLSRAPRREQLLVAVLADGLSQNGEILWRFTLEYNPAAVSGIAMHTLRYVVSPRKLAAAIPALAKLLEGSSYERWWREAARDLVVGYVGKDRARAEHVLPVAGAGTEEALAVRRHCQAQLE